MNAKFLHAAALALVGWYLMLPPAGLNGFPDDDAHISKWKVSKAFDSADECKLDQQLFLASVPADKLVAEILNARDRRERGMPPTIYQKFLLENVDSACISTDDPRLKEK